MPGHCKFNYSCFYNNYCKDELSKVPDDPYVDSTLTIIMFKCHSVTISVTPYALLTNIFL